MNKVNIFQDGERLGTIWLSNYKVEFLTRAGDDIRFEDGECNIYYVINHE